MPVEVEMRARFDEEASDRLVACLSAEAADLGRDDKHIYFYVLSDQLLKVTDNVAAGTAKITLKHSKIGKGTAFPETEFTIARENITAAVTLFNGLGFEKHMHEAFNQRHNYRFRGVEIAVKWSEAWGHHAEFEVLLEDGASSAAHQEATSRIQAVAQELGVDLMTEEQLADFTSAFEAKEQARKNAAEPSPQS